MSLPDDPARRLTPWPGVSARPEVKPVRDALRRQLQVERLADLQRYGRERAEAIGIGPEDSEVVVDESRSGRR